MKKCKDNEHSWIDTSKPFEMNSGDNLECEHCGLRGEIQWNDSAGKTLMRIKAKPLATVISLSDFRKKKVG